MLYDSQQRWYILKLAIPYFFQYLAEHVDVIMYGILQENANPHESGIQ